MCAFRLVLVPIDGSPCSEQAIACAIAIAADQQADIHFVHVISRAPTQRAYNEGEHAMHAAGEKLLDHAVDLACEHDLLGTSTMLATDERHRTVAQQILWAAGAFAADLIVCGSHGTGRQCDAQLGSVAGELALTSHVSLLFEYEAAVQVQDC